MSSVQYGSLPFKEQIDVFRGKVNLPSYAWTDFWEGQHARGFVIAGATREALLVDMRSAVDKIISQGVTLEQFRKDFDSIVRKHGWAYNGGRNWRTRVIYETNLRQSYNAGRYKQMQAVSATRPYWRYRHNDSVEHPRPQHLAWDGLILRHDDPWWSTHSPQNGWGCKCSIDTLSERDMRRLGKSGPDTAPPVRMREVTVGINGPSPRTVTVPEGIDPGFGYNIGEAAWGRQLADDVMQGWRSQGAGAWTRLTPGDWQSAGRPKNVPVDKAVARFGVITKDTAGVEAAITRAIGGDQRVYTKGGVPLMVDAKVLADHIDPSRGPYIPFLPELLNDPFEIWMTFEQHKGTGAVVLRTRWVKLIDVGRRPGLLLVANATRGFLESWSFIPNEPGYLEKQRKGKLIWGRE